MLPEVEAATRELYAKAGKPWPGVETFKQQSHSAKGFIPRPEAILLDGLYKQYAPVFRRGNKIYCASGEEKSLQDILGEPTSGFIDALALAEGAPTFKGGAVNRNALSGFYRTWIRVAYGNLLIELPDEDDAPEGEAAKEDFRRMVKAALLKDVTLGQTIDTRGFQQTQIERRSLIDWAYRFATRVGPWRSVRSYRCWAKALLTPEGELKRKVAIRVEVFDQVHADRRLCDMNNNTFGRRAKRYGIGETSRSERPHGLSAVVLADAFIAEMIDDHYDADDKAEEFGRIGKNQESSDGLPSSSQPSADTILDTIGR
jgi:hypothetical protein